MFDALIFKGRKKNAKISVIEINKEECSIASFKILDIQSYHYVTFEISGLIFWKYFEIDTGKEIPYSNLDFDYNVQIPCPFSSKQKLDNFPNQKSTPLSRKFVSFTFCSEGN